MAYNPYNNYAKKKEAERKRNEELQLKLDKERRTICDGLMVERISTKKLNKMITDTKGQGINFTDPCSAFGYGVMSDKKETLTERMNSGTGVDEGVYYYK